MTSAPNPTSVDKLSAILEDITGQLGGMFDRMEWAEDEITQAIGRHPAKADILWHSFSLLEATNELMAQEFIYRSHCRELLERVAQGEDTRPATDAEICLAMHEISRSIPLHGAPFGLYFRMWAKAFPDQPNFGAEQLEHCEALHASTIDDYEEDMRRRFAIEERTLSDIECDGRHHGETVSCQYAAAAAA